MKLYPDGRRPGYIRPKALQVLRALRRADILGMTVEYDDLAEICECSRRTVRIYIWALRKAGMIEPIRTEGSHLGPGAVHRFRVIGSVR